MTSQNFWTDETEKAVQHLNFIAGPISSILPEFNKVGVVMNIKEDCFEEGKDSAATILYNSQILGFPKARKELKPKLIIFRNDHVLYIFTCGIVNAIVREYASELYHVSSLFRDVDYSQQAHRFLYEAFSPHLTWEEIQNHISRIQKNFRNLS